MPVRERNNKKEEEKKEIEHLVQFPDNLPEGGEDGERRHW